MRLKTKTRMRCFGFFLLCGFRFQGPFEQRALRIGQSVLNKEMNRESVVVEVLQ